jgi:hypothetical protein
VAVDGLNAVEVMDSVDEFTVSVRTFEALC